MALQRTTGVIVMSGDPATMSRRDVVRNAAAASAHGAVSGAWTGGTLTLIDGVRPYRVCDPKLESARIAVARRGERHRPAYIEGTSGAGSRAGGPCPCAPTRVCEMPVAGLVTLLCYEVETLHVNPNTKEQKDSLACVLPRTFSGAGYRRQLTGVLERC